MRRAIFLLMLLAGPVQAECGCYHLTVGDTTCVPLFKAISSTDHSTEKTDSASWTCRRVKNGTDGACQGTVSEVSDGNQPGTLKYALHAGDVDTAGSLLIRITATGMDASECTMHVGLTDGLIKKTTFADDGQLTSESTTTYGLASGAITANNQNVGRALVVYSNANRAIELARCCIASSADTGDTVTCSTDISASITGSGGSADYYGIADDPKCGGVLVSTIATDAITASAIAANAIGASELASDSGTDFWATALAENSSCPVAGATAAAKLSLVYELGVNKVTGTNSALTLRNRADSGDICSFTSISDDGTTLTIPGGS